MAVNLFPTQTTTNTTTQVLSNFHMKNNSIINGKLPISASPVIIPIWLRDTYAYVHPTPVYNLQGPFRENIHTEEAARQLLTKNINLFLSGADVFSYLNRNISKGVCNQTVTIVIHSLRDLYWNYRKILPHETVSNLEMAMREPLPTFKNVFEYKSIQQLSESIDLPQYQMFGTLTPFSVLHIPVRFFIESLNAGVPIQIALEDTNIIIQLDYEKFDFWDTITKSLIDYIDLQNRCQ